ncbi:hypothetical protein KSS87_009978 [Heliosperma pusillum]|nr:hypothetical protein KSS87_009978 [Heliosperma pusillum]
MLASGGGVGTRKVNLTVAIVTSRNAYDNCDESIHANAIEVTGGPYERTLDSSGQFYYFCTIGFHCADGLKFSANARPYLKDKQNLVEIVDRRLEGEFDDEKLHEVCDIIEECLDKQPSSRPFVADIVAQMSYLVT